MLDPYRMIVINVLTSSLTLFGVLFYLYVYPKKKLNLLALLVLVSILPIISIFRQGTYESGDFNIHIYRIMSFYDSLREGILMPSWAGELNATYGNPLFIFNYPLPYYGVSFFHIIGFSFISSMKIYLGLTFLFSGIFMYLWIKKLLHNDLAAFASGIFYLFSPYHLIDVHFRATLGESTIFALVPLQFFFFTQYFQEKKILSLVFTSICTALLFLAHPLLAIVFLGIEVLFILFFCFRNKDFKSFLLSMIALISGTIATMYVWASFFIYSPYTFKLTSQQGQENPLFYPFNQILYSPWRYGLLFQGHHGELALIIGYTQIFVLVVSMLLVLVKKVPKKILEQYVFWIFVCLSVIFAMHPISGFLWKYIHRFGEMLTLYGRLSLALSFCTSIIAGYFILVLLQFKRRNIYISLLLTLTIGLTILNWGHRRVIPEINDDILRKNVWKSTIAEGKTAYFLNTKWADTDNFWFSELPKQHLEIIQGKGKVRELKRTSTTRQYIVNADTAITVKENTLYFPGWSLKSNDNKIAIYPGKRGVIQTTLSKGFHYVEVVYEDLPIYKALKKIFQTWLIIIISLLFYSGICFLVKTKKEKKIIF